MTQTLPNPKYFSCIITLGTLAVNFFVLHVLFLFKNTNDSHFHLKPSANQTTKQAFFSSARKCKSSVDSTQDANYMRSQLGEDAMLLKWFSTLCGGTYIELGALDGVQYSNSHLFHYTRQWKGVLIELMGHNYENLILNRKNELATIHAGVCSTPLTLHYYGGEPKGVNAVGGIYEFSTPEFRKDWWDDISLDDPKVNTIECDTMDNLLKKNTNQTFFDFLSLDVEGAELSVLESIDFKRVGFGIIFAEQGYNHLKSLAMREFVENHGYDFLQEYQGSYWWINRDFYHIYKNEI